MYNSDTPLRAELPSSRQLLRSTILAAISALVLLVVVVLPAEYGIDPTGIGQVLRMTEMGNVKQQLAAEAAADAGAAASAAPPQASGTTPGMSSANAGQPSAAVAVAVALADAPQLTWRDETPFTLAPGEGTEIKAKMSEGARIEFAWAVDGGVVNFDAHADAPGKSISYEKGRGVASDEGELVAAFTGNHGWFFRNRGQSDVKLVLRTRGEYSDLKRVK
jgi:hypothetical protein